MAFHIMNNKIGLSNNYQLLGGGAGEENVPLPLFYRREDLIP